MNGLAKMAAFILDLCDNVYLIASPTHKLIKYGMFLLVGGIILFSFSSGFALVVTFPLLLFECYFYYLFCKIWRAYRFSVVYLIILPIVAIIATIGIRILFS